ncbi:MAG: hypothetical protein JSS93_12825 [Bacteroidetes bacterium]|nr:hypothetical protein [Bacteroidota bacterium]
MKTLSKFLFSAFILVLLTHCQKENNTVTQKQTDQLKTLLSILNSLPTASVTISFNDQGELKSALFNPKGSGASNRRPVACTTTTGITDAFAQCILNYLNANSGSCLTITNAGDNNPNTFNAEVSPCPV